MSSPMNIKKIPGPLSGSTVPSVNTPNSRAFQYTPPVANIPPRGTTGQNIPIADGTSQQQPTLDFNPSSIRPSIDGGLRKASTALTSSNITEISHLDPDEFPDEEKAKVLARHLRLREEGATNFELPKPAPSVPETASIHSNPSSQRSTTPRDTGKAREDSVSFPISYDIPGADTT